MKQTLLVVLCCVLSAASCGIRPATAQENTFAVCAIHVTHVAGDAIQNPYLGQPSHWYISKIYQGGDASNQFLAWARSAYGSGWIKNPDDGSDEASVGCNVYDSLDEASQYLSGIVSGYDTIDNSYDSLTGWPF